jgi:hypothetical protein
MQGTHKKDPHTEKNIREERDFKKMSHRRETTILQLKERNITQNTLTAHLAPGLPQKETTDFSWEKDPNTERDLREERGFGGKSVKRCQPIPPDGYTR